MNQNLSGSEKFLVYRSFGTFWVIFNMFCVVVTAGCSSSRKRESCTPGDVRDCTCAAEPGTQQCLDDGTWELCVCENDGGVLDGALSDGDIPLDGLVADSGEPDAHILNFCADKSDGDWCDGQDLVICAGDEESGRSLCPHGCDDSLPGGNHACQVPNPDFCIGKLNGRWCDGDDLVYCLDNAVLWRLYCSEGCVSMPTGTPDECAYSGFCSTVPDPVSPTAPTEACNYMDWNLSSDGFYLISRFGTSNDGTTWGKSTSCGFLQGHYDYHACRYDVQTETCLDNDYEIPWVHGHVDYIFEDVLAEVYEHMNGDVPTPEYFYVACAQRFNCGVLLRVSHPENGRCVVVYTEDGGPGATYEGPDYGGRRILDASPAVSEYLLVDQLGWANSDLLYVEWGLDGDVPGRACIPCQSSPAEAGSEHQRSPYDLNHMMSGLNCR